MLGRAVKTKVLLSVSVASTYFNAQSLDQLTCLPEAFVQMNDM